MGDDGSPEEGPIRPRCLPAFRKGSPTSTGSYPKALAFVFQLVNEAQGFFQRQRREAKEDPICHSGVDERAISSRGDPSTILGASGEEGEELFSGGHRGLSAVFGDA